MRVSNICQAEFQSWFLEQQRWSQFLPFHSLITPALALQMKHGSKRLKFVIPTSVVHYHRAIRTSALGGRQPELIFESSLSFLHTSASFPPLPIPQGAKSFSCNLPDFKSRGQPDHCDTIEAGSNGYSWYENMKLYIKKTLTIYIASGKHVTVEYQQDIKVVHRSFFFFCKQRPDLS